MLSTVMNDKQFIFGLSLGVVCSIFVAIWKRSKSPPTSIENSTSVTKKRRKNAELKMVIVVRKDAKLVKREMIVHCAIAAAEAFKKSSTVNPRLVKQWQNWGQMKIAVKVNSESELLAIKSEADKKNLVNHLVRCSDVSKQAGLVLAIGPDYVDDIDAITGHLKLL